MIDSSKSSTIVLRRQPDPEPPPNGAAQEPSLVLYGALVLFAFILMLPELTRDRPDWRSLCTNLATEIIGAVIILLIIDRRLRSQDVRFIRNLPAVTQSFISGMFRTQAWQIQAYSRVFYSQIDSAMLSYISRPDIEKEMANRLRGGFFLSGEWGIGKTTLLLDLAKDCCASAVRNPQSALVPVFLPARKWLDGDFTNALLQSARQFFHFREETFLMLLRSGRIAAICDGIDEASPSASPVLVEGLKNFRQRYPNVPLIVSGRTLDPDLLDRLEMPKLTVPIMSEDETKQMLTALGLPLSELSSMTVVLTNDSRANEAPNPGPEADT